jgi:beta-lactamase class D
MDQHELARRLHQRRIADQGADDQIAFIEKLLDMLTPFQCSALEFGLDMTPVYDKSYYNAHGETGQEYYDPNNPSPGGE